jgi:nitrite reductase/ring-hydroxylating ferredoxin subunit
MLDHFVGIATLDDLTPNRMILRLVQSGEGVEEILVVRIGDEVFALDDRCTHAAANLHNGDLYFESYEIECPLHGGRFDLRTGEVTGPPPEQALTTYAVLVEGGTISVGPTM